MKEKLLWMLIALLLFALSACGAFGGSAVSFAPPDEVNSDSGSDKVSVEKCPEAESGTHLLLHPAQGYCFLYPDNYDVFESDDGAITLYQTSLLNTEAPVASLERQPANGEKLQDITAQLLVNFALPESEIEDATLGDRPAIILNNLPSQDTNRRLVAVNDDFVYDLMVARTGPEYGPVGEQAEALFDQISSSFQFIGVEPEAPLLAGPECPQAEEGTMLFTNEEDGYCFLLPEAYKVEPGLTLESGGRETAVFQNSALDVEHARLFLKVEDAEGRSLEEVTTALETEIETAVPNYDIAWSFGYMLDGVAANRFDQVPGQDFSRRLIFIYYDRLYTLTFIPDDPQAGEAYAEMESLYNLVVESFSFLRAS